MVLAGREHTRMTVMAETEQLWRGSVHRLIRCRKTHRYFNNGQWTKDPVHASTFPDELEAVRACVHHGLTNIDLVLRARGSQADLFCTPIR